MKGENWVLNRIHNFLIYTPILRILTMVCYGHLMVLMRIVKAIHKGTDYP